MERLFLEDFVKYKFLSGVKFSPNGLYTGFVCHEIDLEENKYISNIYLLRHRDSSLKKLTTLGEERTFTWKDENTILFPSIRNKKDIERKKKGEQFTSFYEIDINWGEGYKVFEIPLNVNEVKFIDKDNILFTANFDPNRADFNLLSDDENVEVLDEIPFWSNGQGFTNKIRNRLYIYNIKDNILKPITDEFTNVNNFNLNAEKSMIVMITNSFIDKKYTKSDLQIYNIEEDRLTKISHVDEFSYTYADFLEDKICFIGTDMKSYGINENPHFYIVDYDGYNSQRISSDDFDFSIWNSIGSDCRYGKSNTMKVDENYIYFVTTEGDSSFINRINIKGEIEKLTNKKGSIDGLDVYKGNINFIGLRSLKLQELYSLNNKKKKTIDLL